MTDTLYLKQVALEEAMRNHSISRFRAMHEKAEEKGNFSETEIGSSFIRGYLIPFSLAIDAFVNDAKGGRAKRLAATAEQLSQVDPEVAAFLFLKALMNRLSFYGRDRPPTTTALAIAAAGLIEDEVRVREFEQENRHWFGKMWEDFNKRELPRYKRAEYLRRTFRRAAIDWNRWPSSEKVHIGVKLIELFKDSTGDLEIRTVGYGRRQRDEVIPSQGLLDAVFKLQADREALTSVYYPTIIPPVPWSPETLDVGSYHTHHITPYPLVKRSRREYRKLLQKLARDGKLNTTLRAINAIQETPWRVNREVLEVVEKVYELNIPCGKLPPADNREPEPPPASLEGLDYDHPEVIAYRGYRATIHEENRMIVAKRIMAVRALHMARQFSGYEAIYFPHDLDSRGRAYPKPAELTPQGPDYVRGLLEFSEGKRLGTEGVYWLGVHGANTYGEDKLTLDERYQWSLDNTPLIQAVAQDPLGDLRWTEADNPVQFLAFCKEWNAMQTQGGRQEDFVSHLPISLDATCSGLQHFSAMLRDEVGGRHVNMTSDPTRQDVYEAVAIEARKLMEEDLEGDKGGLARAWLDSRLMNRDLTKRPVMVKPYAGTRQSCIQYVSDGVSEALAKGHPLPWPKKDLMAFQLYGADVVWRAIPRVVIAADDAMRWLTDVSRRVARSQPAERRIEWVTPVGLPVWQHKMNTLSRRVVTRLDGSIYKPRIREETDKMDSRRSGTSIPPSFVHSLDAAHLQLTVDKAVDRGIHAFAMIHDSFGVHASKVPEFSKVIREAFVEMYSNNDVLADFEASTYPMVDEKNREDFPERPPTGKLDLREVLRSEFFFS